MARPGDEAPTTDGRAGSGRRGAEAPAGEPGPAAAAPASPPRADAGPPDLPARFEPGAELGRGGMGRVVEAFDHQLGRTVAVKEATEADDDARVRFAREVRITAQLQHPGIVPLYEAGRGPSGAPYYVMRKVTGQTLRDRVASAATVSDRLALVPNVLAACDAVAYAHSRGILHRDLKPANILVGEHGETVVIDWGIAKALDEDDQAAPVPPRLFAGLTSFGAVVGTPGYMAPEQGRGEPVDRRTDVYALGATLAHVLAGASPEDDGHVTLPDAVPAELAAIVSKAMADGPTTRYPDASGLATDLRRFLTGQLVAAHRYSRRQRLVRFARRHRAALLVAAGATVALTTTVGLAIGNVVRARDRAEASAKIARAAGAEAERRTEDNLLARAESLLDVDPTRAAVVAASLPLGSSRWPSARAIIESARRAGLTRLYPIPARSYRVLVHPTRDELLVLSNEAPPVRIDLPTGRQREVPGIVTAHDLAWYGDASAVVLTVPGQIRIVGLDGRARRELTVTGSATLASAAQRPALAYATVDGVFLVEDGADPRRLVIEHSTEKGSLEFSPDGRWLTWWSVDHGAVVWDTQAPEQHPRQLTTAPVTTAAFSPSSDRIIVSEYEQLVEHVLRGDAESPSRRWPTPRPGALNVLHLGAVALGIEPLRGLVRYHSLEMAQVLSLELTPYLAAWSEAKGHGFAYVVPGGLEVSSSGWVRHLRAPTLGLRNLAASRTGRLLVAPTTQAAVAVWRLDADLRPSWSRSFPGSTRPLDDDVLLSCEVACAVTSLSGRWPDRALELPLPMLRGVLAAPWSRLAMVSVESPLGPGHLAVDLGTGATVHAATDDLGFLTLAGVDGVLMSKDGRIGWGHPLTPDPVRDLGPVEGTVVGLAGNVAVGAAATSQGRLVRIQLAAGTRDEVMVAPGLTGPIAISTSGQVFAAREATLVRWRPGQPAADVAALSAPIQVLVPDERDLTGRTVVAITTDGSVHHLGADDRVRSTAVPTLLDTPSLSWGGVVVGRSAGGTVLRIDAVSGVVQRLPGGAVQQALASPSGRTVMVLRTDGIDGYVDDLPTDPIALRAWLATASNARLAADGVSMTWADPRPAPP